MKPMFWELFDLVINTALVVYSVIAAFNDRYALATFLLAVVIFNRVVDLKGSR